MTVIVKGYIKTEGPLSIAMPTADGGRPNDYGNFPLMGRGINDEGKPALTGMLPATTLRGALRRGAVLPEMEAAAKSGEPMALRDVYENLIGQDTGSEKSQDTIDLLKLQKDRDEKPIVDLFGSGLGISSRLLVSHFVPHVNVLPEAVSGVRKDIDDTPDAFTKLSGSDQDAFVNRSTANSERADNEKLVKGLKQQIRKAEKAGSDTDALNKQLEAAQRQADKSKADMGEMKNSSRTLVGYHALPAGLELEGKLVIKNDRDRDIELLVRGLDHLSRFPVLGAQSARGCGEVSGTFDFYRDGVLFKRVTIGDYAPAVVDDLGNEIAAA